MTDGDHPAEDSAAGPAAAPAGDPTDGGAVDGSAGAALVSTPDSTVDTQEPVPLSRRPGVVIRLDPANVWRIGWVVVALAAVTSFLYFVLHDGGGVLFTLLMAWFASIAMEPAVSALARHMKRGLATGLTMLAIGLALVIFLLLFGRLVADQLILAFRGLPGLVQSVLDWVNNRFGTEYNAQTALTAIGITPDVLTEWVKDAAGGLLGFVVSAVAGFFSTFTFLLFLFYFSADAPRLKRWVARIFPGKYQSVVVNVWDLAVEKTGGYVAARVVLATINGSTTAIFLLIIGMPYWLVLGIWTGVVAQFVPTVGTYIAITLPVLVGLFGDNPTQGLLALAWGLAYQQVENLTLEPNISAKAVDVHPAVSFASVMLGVALFGPAGALLAVPVAALLLALFDIYARKYELLPELTRPEPPPTSLFQSSREGLERLADAMRASWHDEDQKPLP